MSHISFITVLLLFTALFVLNVCFMFIYLFIFREIQNSSERGREERQNLHSQCTAQCRAGTHELQDHDLSPDQELDSQLTAPPRHPSLC